MKKLFICLFSLSAIYLNAQETVELNRGWKWMNVSKVTDDPSVLSQPGYSTASWKPAIVPGTVLTNLVAQKEMPDPFYGMNNKRIPDIFHTGPDYYTYWFVKDFTETYPTSGRQIWLHFRGVNYAADIYLNGKKLNDTTFKGMFLRQRYNITSLLLKNGKNRLAIIVYPPNPVGNPNGGQGGDGTIAKNVTHQYVAGWDWIQPVRDRNTGIWDKVFIERTGSIDIKDPHLVTLVPGKRSSTGVQQPAIVQVSASLENTSNKEVKGVMEYRLEGKRVFKNVTLPALRTTTVRLPDFELINPKLWWPTGYGQPHLYSTVLKFTEQNGRTSDVEKLSFGARQIERTWNPVTKSSQFHVNGQKIFLKGGNWIISDAMLRLSADRYDAEVRFHRDMHLNLIRIWGGALLERPEFYEACDRYGLLVFQDLWITGDCNGRWNDRMKLESREERRKYPDDHELFIKSAADGIKMIRNHPSLAIWCGGNEYTPPGDILRVLKDSLFPALDSTRYFFDLSTSDSMSMNILNGGGDGPYSIQPIDTFWKFRTYPFNSEIGSVGTGDIESLRRFIPEQNLVMPEFIPPAQPGARPTTKVDSVWDYHKYIGYNQYINRYGQPKTIEDFLMRAQLINYQQYRALIEGFTGHMWNWYTGVIIWKTQNPWTALRGQMYDYYLDPNACLYGLRNGSEPLHIMYNTVEGDVIIANHHFRDYPDLEVRIRAFDMDGSAVFHRTLHTNAAAASLTSTGSIKQVVDSLGKAKGIFLALELHDKARATVSENTYWIADAGGNYSGLVDMKPAGLEVHCRKVSKGKIEVTLQNKQGFPLSFFNRISLVDPVKKERILPVFYSDNYVTILPGKTRKVILQYDAPVVNPLVSVYGWNKVLSYYEVLK